LTSFCASRFAKPLEEQALRTGIKCLTPITVGSLRKSAESVRTESIPALGENAIREQALRFNDEMRRSLPFAPFTPMPDDSAPEALIAGCGTGNAFDFCCSAILRYSRTGD